VTSIIHKYTNQFASGQDLDLSDGETLLDALITETDEAILANLFHAWNQKGIAEDEIFAIANVLRERCTRVATKHETFVDIVGTGGSRVKTFNVSTAAAFVVAGAGVPVAKHGNRAATSNSGSADVLAELGVEPAVDAATAGRCLDEIGICFMFAPNFHRLSPTLGKVRRGIGFPTIFNCVGPLCNPASAPHQLIGVWREEMVPKMANALARLGTKKSWVVHGSDGLDEISLDRETLVAEIANGGVTTFRISPVDFGIESDVRSEIRTVSALSSAKQIQDMLAGKHRDHAAETIVCLNSAAVLILTEQAADLSEGFRYAIESVRSRKAAAKLELLARATGNR
jgi:anthranilate phosphoribosyltransferase